MKKMKCEQCEKYYNGDKFLVCPYCNPAAPVCVTEQIEKECKPEILPENKPAVFSNSALTIGGVVRRMRTCSKCGRTYDELATPNCVFCDSKQDSEKETPVKEISRVVEQDMSTVGRLVVKRGQKSDLETASKERETAVEYSNTKENEIETPKCQSKQKYATVGWLMCISGVNVGHSFEVFDAQNSIGRNQGNMIVIENELSVSREKHCVIIYDYKHSEFWLQSGDNASTTYLNDSLVMENKRLNPYDVIEIGECRLMFVPFCTSERNWNTITKNE